MSNEPEIGQSIGKYVIEAKLGQGGMGAVYRARDTALERTVALKLLPKHLAYEPSFRERFRREARKAARLTHANVVQIFEVGEADGDHFIAMQFLGGGSLEDLIRREKRLDPNRAARIVRDAAKGLARAHAQGIIHRDIKPANILLDVDGEVRLGDFGLVKELGDDENLTQTGAILGTPQFMAPEQCEGLPDIDGRADLYALGVVLYTCLSGRIPAEGRTPLQIIHNRITKDPPPLTRVAPGVPPALVQVVTDLLVRERERRLGRADELVQRLEAFLATGAPGGVASSNASWGGGPTQVPPATPARPIANPQAFEATVVDSAVPVAKLVTPLPPARTPAPTTPPPAAATRIDATPPPAVATRVDATPTPPAAKPPATRVDPPRAARPPAPPRKKKKGFSLGAFLGMGCCGIIVISVAAVVLAAMADEVQVDPGREDWDDDPQVPEWKSGSLGDGLERIGERVEQAGERLGAAGQRIGAAGQRIEEAEQRIGQSLGSAGWEEGSQDPEEPPVAVDPPVTAPGHDLQARYLPRVGERVEVVSHLRSHLTVAQLDPMGTPVGTAEVPDECYVLRIRYTSEALQVAGGRVTRARRRYLEMVEVRSGEAIDVGGLEVDVLRDDGEYDYELVGGGYLPTLLEALLADEIDGLADVDPFLPRRPVKVEESWPIASGVAADEMGISPAAVRPSGSQVSGRLVRAEAGAQREVRFDARLLLEELKGVVAEREGILLRVDGHSTWSLKDPATTVRVEAQGSWRGTLPAVPELAGQVLHFDYRMSSEEETRSLGR